MNKLLSLAIILVLPLVAVAKKPKVYKEATKSCEAFNDMKHRNNTNSISLEVGQKYRVLSSKEGQFLILVDGQRVAQRWVDENCFSKEQHSAFAERIAANLSEQNKKKSAKKNLLALSWQNAFCQTHQYKKECKAMDKDSFGAFEFVLHGLWPQPRNNLYCGVDKKQKGMDKNKQWYRLNRLDLNSTVRQELSKYMPGYSSKLHRHEWIKHGTCYGKEANEYYDDAIKLLKQVNNSKVQQYFKKNIGKKVTIKEVRRLFDEEFGKGAGDHVALKCKGGLVTELWLYLGSGSDDLKTLLKDGERVKSRCQKGKVDAVGF